MPRTLRAPHSARLRRPCRQRNQRPVPHRSRSHKVPPQHCPSPRLRPVLSRGFLHRSPRPHGNAHRHGSDLHRRARYRTHHANLRPSRLSKKWIRPPPDGSFSVSPQRARLSRPDAHGHCNQRQRRPPLRKSRLPNSQDLRRRRLATALTYLHNEGLSNSLAKFKPRPCLPRPNPPNPDLCLGVILTSNRSARQTAQHRNLPDMSQSVSNRPLENFLRRACQRLSRGDPGIKGLDRGEEAVTTFFPRQRRRAAPLLRSICFCEGPFEKVSQMSEDLSWPARCLAHAKLRKSRWRSAKRLCSAVS